MSVINEWPLPEVTSTTTYVICTVYEQPALICNGLQLYKPEVYNVC